LTVAFLVPFSAKSFHIDDPLFVWMAQHLVHHPFDPYGFRAIWFTRVQPAYEIIKNPPLASYYMAAVGATAGWSERVLHVAFLLPALVVVLGTYHLAGRFTQNPLFAAAATLLTPGFLVSSTSVMCDTMMLALWIAALLLWVEGLERAKPWLLFGSALLVAACALTKYFGMALIPLLAVYAIARKRPLRSWFPYLLIPVALLAGYQYWTEALYGRGLLADAAQYAHRERSQSAASPLAKAVVGFAFVGGCALTGLTCLPLLWSRRRTLLVAALAGLAGMACAMGWISLNYRGSHRIWAGTQLGVFVAGGISTIALSLADWWKRRTDAQSLLLASWVLGAFVFAAILNWTVNARSVLPMIPAVGILLARRADSMGNLWQLRRAWRVAIPLTLAAIVSLWITWADARLAHSARLAAEHFQENTTDKSSVSFQGHWGFQYYMQSFGFQPVDFSTYHFLAGNAYVLPENNTNLANLPAKFIASRQEFDVAMKTRATTMRLEMGAGFYSDLSGPLPYAFGPVPPERYFLVQTLNRKDLPAMRTAAR
jgi:hypothetical protein